MLCDFQTVAFSNGLFVHRCRRCGARRTGRAGRVVRECPAPPPEISIVIVRLGICQHCTERPEGCWKAVEYGCQRKYQEARRRAAETGDCPIGKLKRDER
jgi:hypothetical protein